jgi:predicted metal-dependent enzyme (double-stranded beta helix superfamily)
MKSIREMKQAAKAATDTAQVARRRDAMLAALDGDAAALAGLVQGAELDQILEHADEMRKITARLENTQALFGDVGELKSKAEAARLEHLAAVAEEQKRFQEMKQRLGALIAQHRDLRERISAADRDQRRLAELQRAYNLS